MTTPDVPSPEPLSRAGRKKRTTGLMRWVRHKLIVPVLRLRQSPDYAGRSVAVGLFIGMSPALGLHTLVCGGLWLLARTIMPQWNFSVIIALAWTFISNPLTIPPFFYTYLVTGRFLLGDHGRMPNYHTITVHQLLDQFALPLMIGFLPWAICVSVIGYFATSRLIRRRQPAPPV